MRMGLWLTAFQAAGALIQILFQKLAPPAKRQEMVMMSLPDSFPILHTLLFTNVLYLGIGNKISILRALLTDSVLYQRTLCTHTYYAISRISYFCFGLSTNLEQMKRPL